MKKVSLRSMMILLSVFLIATLLPAGCKEAEEVAPAVEEVEEAAEEVTKAPDEIKIGLISAFTGVFASFGEMQKQGAILALEEVDYMAGGKNITVIYEDDQLDNEMAVTKSKKLVEQDKIDILTGMVSGDEGLAVADYMKGKNIPVIPMYSASEDMTMRSFYPMIIRITWTGAQSMDVFGYYLAKEKGFKKIYQIGEDYSYPWNQSGGFKRGFYRGGGIEVKSIWFPPGSIEDFSSMIATIPLDQGYDAVLYNGAGGDAVNFIKQFVELGMEKKITLVGQSNTFEKPDLDSMPEGIVGCLSAHHTTDDMATPEWLEFKDAFTKRWDRDPSAASEFAYSTMVMIIRGIEAMNGDVSDKTDLVNAMINVDMKADPRGPITIDPIYHSAIENVYIREVAKDANGKLYNKGILTVNEVSQFGPYDTELYMKQPIDTNKYPPDTSAEFPTEMLKADYEYIFTEFGK